MRECNTGLDCEDCIGGCEHNLESLADLEFDMCTYMNIKFKKMSFEEAEKQAVLDIKESKET